MTQNEIEELSRSLDELNSGHPPASGDAETAGLLEIAALLKRADLPVSPPPHILTAAVQSAADGIRAARSRRNKWMYSGLLGAAASLLIFLGLNSLPNWQTSATVPPRSPAPQQAQTISPPADSASAASQKNLLPAAEAPAASPATNSTAAPAAAPASSQPEKSQPIASAPSSVTEPKPSASPKLAARAAPLAKETVPAPLAPLRIPGRTPDSISTDTATGSLRQVYDADTPQEIVIIQRWPSKDNNEPAPQAKFSAAQNSDTAAQKKEAAVYSITVTINAQDVTLSGRKTRQELLDLAAILKP